jgi:hypothetical protein
VTEYLGNFIHYKERHMTRTPLKTLLSTFLLCTVLASFAWGLNYMYFTEIERTRFGERIKFWHGDTLAGPVRSNDTLAIMEDPTFYDYVISSAPDAIAPIGWPWFGGVYFDADSLHLPTTAVWLRQQALGQQHYYVGDDSLFVRVRLEDHNLHVWWIRRFAPLDTLLETDYPLADTAAVFFTFPEVDLFGIMNSVLYLGASGRIGLVDNVLYASSDPITGAIVPGHPEKLAVVSESEIKILNTWANGRENSHGQGLIQPHPDSTSIALNGIYAALGESFTFDQQNDPDSGYVCTCFPDDRGTIFLAGSIIQRQRGYVHRSTRSSTGYLKNHSYDNDLRFWDIHLFNVRENQPDRDMLNFAELAPGETVRDTLTLYNDYVPLKLDTLLTVYPFTAATFDTAEYLWHPRIAVEFAPTEPGVYESALQIPIPYYDTTLTVTLRGTCVAPNSARDVPATPQAFALSASPNPFNAMTRITFSLPVAGHVSLKVYDVLGRECAVLKEGLLPAGPHAQSWDATAFPSGLYFARLTSGNRTLITKLLLLK